MRMQEVITQLREDVPVLAKHSQATDVSFRKAWGLYDDLMRCESTAARTLLTDAFGEAMNEFAKSYADMRTYVERLEELNGGYTRKLGPRKAEPKEDPRQMKLDLEPSPASQADSANAAFAGGRHG